jgi:hypothetical protein
MRRLLWCAVAVVVAGGLGLYALAAYAVCHPHSRLGRETSAMLRLAGRLTPLTALAGSSRERPSEAIVDAGCPSCNAEPGDATTPPTDPQQDGQMMAFIRSYPSAVHLDGNVAFKPAKPAASEQCSKDDADRALRATLESGGEEEFTGAAPRFMPPCSDDDEPPAMMPCAKRYDDEEELSGNPFGLEIKQSDPAKRELDTTAEESEIPFDRALSNGQDPNYRYQYPGCPSTGPARKAGRTVHETSFTPLSDPKSGKKLSLPGFDRLRSKSRLPEGGYGEEEEFIPRTTLDTMEFRPSDAKNGEFKKRIQ